MAKQTYQLELRPKKLVVSFPLPSKEQNFSTACIQITLASALSVPKRSHTHIETAGVCSETQRRPS